MRPPGESVSIRLLLYVDWKPYSQSCQPLVSITLPSGRRSKNSPVSSLIFTRFVVREPINLWI